MQTCLFYYSIKSTHSEWNFAYVIVAGWHPWEGKIICKTEGSNSKFRYNFQSEEPSKGCLIDKFLINISARLLINSHQQRNFSAMPRPSVTLNRLRHCIANLEPLATRNISHIAMDACLEGLESVSVTATYQLVNKISKSNTIW